MKKIALIVAGGIGKRMGSGTPKQFLELKGKPVLIHTVETFIKAIPGIKVILVLPGEYMQEGKQIVAAHISTPHIEFVTGGPTRFHSVQNGLARIMEESVIFVHDAVRCLVSEDLIQRCLGQTIDKGSAIPAVAARDSIRIFEGNTSKVLNRDAVRIIQTPQTFLSHLLIPSFHQSYQESFTDEATVVEASGKEIFLIEGEETNIKITLPADMIIAEKILEERELA